LESEKGFKRVSEGAPGSTCQKVEYEKRVAKMLKKTGKGSMKVEYGKCPE